MSTNNANTALTTQQKTENEAVWVFRCDGAD